MRRLDETRRLRIVAKRATDLANADLQRAIGNEDPRPDRIEQLSFLDKASGTVGEVLEQRDRFRRQGDGARVCVQLSAGRVETKAIEGERNVRRHETCPPATRDPI